MPARSQKLNEKQIEVLRWVGAGCPARDWPDETYKNSALALSNRGLAVVRRKSKHRPWSAEITTRGQYYLEHGAMPAPPKTPEPEPRLAPPPDPRRGQAPLPPDAPPLDATARAMRRVQNRKRPTTVRETKREIKETYMRYKVVVTRVQVAERLVRASSEEAAAEKVQEEFNKPYGYFGSWKTTSSEVDVVEAEQTTVIHPTPLSEGGPMLLSVKDAAKSLGISYSTLYTMMTNGEIEWVLIGSRKYVSREHLLEFIKANTHKGYYAAKGYYAGR